MIKEMLDSAKKDVVAYMKFVQSYRKLKNQKISFVEGDDDIGYYYYRIQKEFNTNNISFFPCGGKKEVLNVKAMIEKDKIKEENGNMFLFFVDKDYDFCEVPPDVFKTDFYSVENYYLNHGLLKSVLNCYLRCNEGDNNYNLAIEMFDEAFRRYSIFAKKMNVFFYTVRKFETDNRLKRNDFNSIKISEFITKSSINDFVFLDYSYIELLEKYNIECDIDESFFINNEKLFTEENHSNYRGKFEMQFLQLFLECLRMAIKKEEFGFIKRNISNYGFQTDLYTCLSQYALTTDNLVNYLLMKSKIQLECAVS